MIITDALFADFAKLGSFVFKDNVMWSQQGSTPNYTDPGFVPNLEIDGETGKMKASEAEISGRISTPFVYKEASEIDGTILDFGDTFNLMVSSNYPNTTTIYLPKEKKYNGTECRIFNSGISDVKVGLVGGMFFEGVGTKDLPSIYTIPGRHMGIFVAVGAFQSGVVWVCTNPERLIPSYPVEE